MFFFAKLWKTKLGKKLRKCLDSGIRDKVSMSFVRSDNLRSSLSDSEIGSDVVFLVGCEPDVQRIPANTAVLSRASPVFRAMFQGPMAASARARGKRRVTAAIVHAGGGGGEGGGARLGGGGASTMGGGGEAKNTVAVSDVDGRAFDVLLRYLYNESVTLQSVMTALTTLYAAHKYMCPGLAKVVVKYLKENLTERNVLLILQHICLYCNNSGDNGGWDVPVTAPPTSSSGHAPSAPPLFDEEDEVEDDEEEDRQPLLLEEDDLRDFEAGMSVTRTDPRGGKQRVNCCQGLLKDCLELIDSKASVVLASEDLEDIDISALKMVVCRETLGVKSEVDVFTALYRWSGRECKRQKVELTNKNRRRVLEGAQFLVRYLTLPREEFVKASGLLTEEEQDSLLSLICRDEGVPSVVDDVQVPDHLSELLGILRTRRRGRPLAPQQTKRASRLAAKLRRKEKKEKDKEERLKAAEAAALSAERDRRKVNELKERNKQKFSLVEEFFICLACIFD